MLIQLLLLLPCGVHGREVQRRPRNLEVPSSIPGKGCQLWDFLIGLHIRREDCCSFQEASSREISINCKNLFLNRCKINMFKLNYFYYYFSYFYYPFFALTLLLLLMLLLQPLLLLLLLENLPHFLSVKLSLLLMLILLALLLILLLLLLPLILLLPPFCLNIVAADAAVVTITTATITTKQMSRFFPL